jgi:hypothetical protein
LIADAFVKQGYACAFLDYRLARPAAVLTLASRRLLPKIIEDAELSGEEMQESFRRRRPIAVVEDVCNFYSWLSGRESEFNLSGSHILAGSSAGGISVLNTLMLYEKLEKSLPKIRSAFVFSGGFAYPSFWRDTDTRVLALHNPLDAHIPFSSIQRVAKIAKRNFTLIVSGQHAHGSPCVNSEESYAAAVARLIAFDQDAGTPDDV